MLLLLNDWEQKEILMALTKWKEIQDNNDEYDYSEMVKIDDLIKKVENLPLKS